MADKLYPYLTFGGKAREAMTFYRGETFGMLTNKFGIRPSSVSLS